MKSKYWILLLGAAFALCVLAGAALLFPKTARQAVIISDGATIATVDLLTDQQLVVPSSGGSNTVTVKDGKIAVTSATCPDHYCMQRGFCDGGTPIVCLPNKLVIEFVGSQEVDGVVG